MTTLKSQLDPSVNFIEEQLVGFLESPIEQWKGKNWLGLVLTEVRESFENLLIPTEQYYDADEGTYQQIVRNRQ